MLQAEEGAPGSISMWGHMRQVPGLNQDQRIQPVPLPLCIYNMSKCETCKSVKSTSTSRPRLVCVHVRAALDLVRERLDVHVKAVLDIAEDGGVGLRGAEGDGQTLGAKATGAANLEEKVWAGTRVRQVWTWKGVETCVWK